MAEILEPLQRAAEGQRSLMAGTNTDAPPDPLAEEARTLRRLEAERGHLQKAIALAALIPLVAGLYGVIFGPGLTGERLSISGDSHYRYLAGLHFGIGLLFLSCAPNIETTGPRFRLLALLVFIGGLSRFLGMTLTGVPSLYMLGALAMELIVTPILTIWQWRIARAFRVPEKKPAILRNTPPEGLYFQPHTSRQNNISEARWK
jgi:hypothetical protein